MTYLFLLPVLIPLAAMLGMLAFFVVFSIVMANLLILGAILPGQLGARFRKWTEPHR